MKAGAIFATITGVALVAPLAAAAQADPTPVGSRIPRSPSDRDFDAYQYSREESDQEFAAYSNCIVASSAGQRDATAFLRLVPNTAAWGKAGQKLTNPECLRTSFGQVKMRYNLTSLRPALFAAMYRRRFGKMPPTSFVDEPALALDKLYVGAIDGVPKQTLIQLSFGNCVARTDAAAVHRLLMARPWSDTEDAALPAVSVAMGKCLANDQTLRMSRSTARGVVAEAMYHLASGRAAGAVTADATATKGR